MRIACLVFAVLAALGVVLGAVVHFSAFMGVDPFESFPTGLVIALMLGVFVVCFPGFFLATRAKGDELRTKLPKWVVSMMLLILAYAVANFVIAACLRYKLNREGYASRRWDDGSYVLRSPARGHEIVHELSAQEYHDRVHHSDAYFARGAFGCLIVFYSWSLMMLIAKPRASADKPVEKTQQGP
jgi:hypothetical protein